MPAGSWPPVQSVAYTVKRGDTLGKISQAFYGTPSRYREIANFNSIANPDRITVGQIIRVPVDNPLPAPTVQPTPAPALPSGNTGSMTGSVPSTVAPLEPAPSAASNAPDFKVIGLAALAAWFLMRK